MANEARTPLSIFADRIVYIGTDLPGGDRYPIPGSAGRRVPGVLAQVVSFWTHLSNRQMARVDGWLARLIALIPAVGVVFFGTWRSRRGRRIGIIALMLLAALVPPAAFAAWRLWLPFGLMLLEVAVAIALIAVTHRLRLAQNYRASLGFDPKLLERHAAEIESTAEGIERSAAVIVADVRNYTQFVTDHVPDKVQRVMTEYLAEMERVVHERGGYVNKYVGDEIVAVFGFPLEEGGAINRAVEAGRDMLDRVRALNEGWHAQELPTLDGIGVGVDSGRLRFTNIGGRHRIQFDIMGNAVNGASRLQSLTKEYGTPMVLSEEVSREQEVFPGPGDAHLGAGGADAHLEPIGPVAIRGQGERRLYGLRQSVGG
jgi:adenylate cyclase